MQSYIMPTPNHLNLLEVKKTQSPFRDSHYSSDQKFIKTCKLPNPRQDLKRFNDTYFRSRINKINQLKTKKDTNFNKVRINNNLQKIEQHLKRKQQQIFNESTTDIFLSRSEEHFAHKQTSPIRVLKQKTSKIECALTGLSLKKKINMIKKHKQILEKEFHRRRASLQFNERTIAKEENKVNIFRQKLQKVIHVREERNRQRMQHYRQIQQHQNEIMQQKYYLRSTVIDSHNSLYTSRLSSSIQKIKLANQTREQKKQNQHQINHFIDSSLNENKKRCSYIKQNKVKTQESIDSYIFDKKMTVNQRKLQEISQELIALQQQKNQYQSFYREKEQNELYKSRIKERKEELQKKSKLYKLNLMLELNKEDDFQCLNQEENEKRELQNYAITQPYRKKRSTVSTVPDFNFASTTKNNTIYKRSGNSVIENNESEQVSSK